MIELPLQEINRSLQLRAHLIPFELLYRYFKELSIRNPNPTKSEIIFKNLQQTAKKGLKNSRQFAK